MNIAVSLLHIDCPTRTEASPNPPKMQLLGHDSRLYGCCPACHAWVVLDMAPVENPPTENVIAVPIAAGT